jgi:hypothetical protein
VALVAGQNLNAGALSPRGGSYKGLNISIIFVVDTLKFKKNAEFKKSSTGEMYIGM